MQRNRIITGIIVTLTVSFIGFQIFQQDIIAGILRACILPLVTVLYCLSGKSRSGYFFSFLVFYAISEFLGGFSYFAYYSMTVDNILFYVGNLCYIMAYICLILEIFKSINLKSVMSRFPVHVVILVILDIYSVYLVSEISVNSDYLNGTLDYTIEVIYNIVVMLLLTLSLLNYISRDSKKAMNLLLGSLCIVFSEVIQVAYFYVSDKNILHVTYCVLLIFAFCFYYIQAGMTYSRHEVYKTNPVN